MARTSTEISIPETVFKVRAQRVHFPPKPNRLQKGTLVFCVFAILGATARTVIRFHKGHQHIIDKGLLLLACLCLMTATALLYKTASPLY